MPIPKESYEREIWKCESPIERRLYRGLINNHLYPIPQYKVGKYRIDLAFPHQLIAIECDGKAYHSTPKQKAQDKRKDRFLQESGWTVLRFSGSKIHRDLPGVIRKVAECVKKESQNG